MFFLYYSSWFAVHIFLYVGFDVKADLVGICVGFYCLRSQNGVSYILYFYNNIYIYIYIIKMKLTEYIINGVSEKREYVQYCKHWELKLTNVCTGL